MKSHANYVFRADASPQIGSGHIIRCLALADEIKKQGGSTLFITCPAVSPSLQNMIRKQGHSLHMLRDDVSTMGDGEQTLKVIQSENEVDWLIVDHYALDARWERKIRPAVKKIMVIDDLADRSHDCDLLLDQSLGRVDEEYSKLVPKAARLLLGPQYALLRPTFTKVRAQAFARRQKGGPVRRILISFGGEDTYGLTAIALRAIAATGRDVDIDVALGNGDPQALGLVDIANEIPQNVEFHGFEANMAELMLESDLTIGAGGSTSWERCCLGLPSIIIVIAENQLKVARELKRKEIAYIIERVSDAEIGKLSKIIDWFNNNGETRKKMSVTSFDICDGLGSPRTSLQIFPEFTKLDKQVWLRKVKDSDCRQLFEWQRNLETRQFFNSPESPSWDEHQSWFDKKLKDPSIFFNIIVQENVDVGMLRLDCYSKENREGYNISILISPIYKQLGIGSAALRAIRRLAGRADIYAEVAPQNAASLRLFKKNNYKYLSKRWLVQVVSGGRDKK